MVRPNKYLYDNIEKKVCKGTHRVTDDENYTEKWGTTLMFYFAYFDYLNFYNTCALPS